MKSGRLVVKNHRPAQRRVLLFLLVAGAAVAAWGMFELGLYQGGINRLEVARERDTLQQRIEALQAESKQQREQMTIVQRSHEIDQAAYKEVRENLKQLQEEILELRQEVEFYRGIVSPAERSAGLNIQDFKLIPAGEDRLFHYELVLTQVLKNDRTISGSVKLTVQGVQAGEPLSLKFTELTPNNSVKERFRFRYFQKMEGDIRLPEEFVPRNVVVEMSPKKRKQVSNSFPWLVDQG